jgi:predicted PurR-regulated permease PerM
MTALIDGISRPPARISSVENAGADRLLTLASGVVVIAALSVAREVLIPITLAVLLSFVLMPLVAMLRRIHVPNVLAVLLAVVIGLSVIGALVGVIGMQLAGLAEDIPGYAATIESKVQSVRDETLGRLTQVTDRLSRALPASEAPPRPPGATPRANAGTGPAPIPVEVRQGRTDPFNLARHVIEPILAPVESTVIIFIVAVFILLQQEDLRDRLIRLFGSGDLHRTTVAMGEAGRRLIPKLSDQNPWAQSRRPMDMMRHG